MIPAMSFQELSHPEIVAVNIEDALQDFSILLSSLTKLDETGVSPSPHTSSLTYLLSDPSPLSQECMIPSLSHCNDVLFGQDSFTSSKEIAALSLAYPNFYCKSNIAQAPSQIVINLASTFKTLIESRLKSIYSSLLKKKSCMNCPLHEEKNIDITLAKLSEHDSIDSCSQIISICTVFEVFPCKEESSSIAVEEKILPMILTTTIDLNVLGNSFTVSLQTPGTISGALARNGNGLLSSVAINLDTMSLLESLMQQAKSITKAAVGVSTTSSSLDMSIAPQRMLVPDPCPIRSMDNFEPDAQISSKDSMDVDEIPEIQFSLQLLRRSQHECASQV